MAQFSWDIVRTLLPDRLSVQTHASRADTDLQRYGQVLSYLVYENTTFWARTSMLLVAQAALLGFTAIALPPLTSDDHPERIIFILLLSIVGLALSRAQWVAIAAGKHWVDKWHALLLKLEPAAYGDIRFFRGLVGPCAEKPRDSAKRVASRVAILFTVLWALLLVYGAICLSLSARLFERLCGAA